MTVNKRGRRMLIDSIALESPVMEVFIKARPYFLLRRVISILQQNRYGNFGLSVEFTYIFSNSFNLYVFIRSVFVYWIFKVELNMHAFNACILNIKDYKDYLQ